MSIFGKRFRPGNYKKKKKGLFHVFYSGMSVWCFRGRRVINKEAWKLLLFSTSQVSPDTAQADNKQQLHAFIACLEHTQARNGYCLLFLLGLKLAILRCKNNKKRFSERPPISPGSTLQIQKELRIIQTLQKSFKNGLTFERITMPGCPSLWLYLRPDGWQYSQLE